EFDHRDGYRAQELRCPLLWPRATGQSCDHEQFAKGVGCVKYINLTAGGKMRIALDRQAEEYKRIYRQRTAAERINSQAKALGIERPQVRNSASVHNLNTLTYVVINARALERVRAVNVQGATPNRRYVKAVVLQS
ncbi:MAG TPA: transposase, partial [Roseiflexaceae bacterium]